MLETVLTNARIVLPNEIMTGSVRIRDGLIADVDSGSSATGEDLEGEFADVLAWLCTLANINDIDLTAAVQRKYFGDDAPKGHK